MVVLEQTLSENSLKIIEKILLFEILKLKRKTKEIPFYHKNYYTNLINCERAYDEMIGAMEFYGFIR